MGRAVRLCVYCRVVELEGRRDRRTCGQECRQALARFKRQINRRSRALVSANIGYADPPYPRKSTLYRDHPDFAGEVDHGPLLAQLETFDGWALSTDEQGLRVIRPLLVGVDHRMAVWVRGARPGPCRGPASSWEAVLYRPARQETTRDPVLDSLVYTARARTTNPARVIGAKPAAFWNWLFGLVGARPGDRFDDLFPGSGAGSLAWTMYEENAAA